MINNLKVFNKQDTLLVISEYACAKERETGLSTFSNNTVQSLLKKQNSSTARVVILADKEKKAKTSLEYESENKLVIRCFHRDDSLSILHLTALIIKLNKIKTVLIEFEFASFGEPFSLLFFLIVLFFIKLTGKNSFFVLHQVVTDLNGLKQQLGNKRKNALRFLTFSLRLFYRLLGFLNTKIIVTEEEFKGRLSHYVTMDKIVCIPHGVEYINNQSVMEKRILKEKFGCADSDYIIMIFGYIAWYKGILQAIRAFKNVPSTLYGKKIRLVIAGGESNTQRNKKHYQKYYQEILNAAKNDQRVVITGFVSNQAIPAFFNRADVCLFPYQAFISSSGPLSLALAFKKPILLSNNLNGYLHSHDFARSMQETHLLENELFLSIEPSQLTARIQQLIMDADYRNRLVKFASHLGKERQWDTVALEYARVLRGDSNITMNNWVNRDFVYSI